ncbi:hypothetical protein TWF481_007776 [Arthrobotrys musiformis]|uniref:DUF7514 domain-containing protein n=1 Tax=Arthrobotrys musiformis TaxID=47236 RepID=A0AAV9WCP8_9PEZI
MSLRHTIKTLLSGPQTQAPPAEGYGYNNQAPGPPPNSAQQHHQQYGVPAPYGYHQAGPSIYGGPAASYSLPQGPPVVPPHPQSYGYAPPSSHGPQMYVPPPQQQQPQPQPQQQQNQQYHCPATAFNSRPTGPSYNHNGSGFAPQNGLSYAPPSAPPPQPSFQQPHPTPYMPQFSPTAPSTTAFQPSPGFQSPGQYPPPIQYGAPPPVPSATHPAYQQPANVPNHQPQPEQRQQTQQQPTGDPVLQYAQVPPHRSAQQQPLPTPLSPPPPYMQFEQASVPQSAATAGSQQRVPQMQPGSETMSDSQRLASTKPQSGQDLVAEGLPSASTSPSGIIHPSMLAQWNSATSIASGPIPNLPSAQSQSPPKSTSPNPKATATTNPAPPQPMYPGAKGHKPTGSVNRSFTFSKKNADGSPNWNGVLLTIDGMSSETFTRFVNGLYNFAGQDEDPLGLTPGQMLVLLERLNIPDERNYPKRYSLAASKANGTDPANFVHTSLIQYYSIFDVTYITESNLMPIVTRDGFQQYMTTEVLIDPSAMHGRFLRLLANFGHQIIDPFTKTPFGNIQFDRECLPPVPNDQYVARDKKQQEALQSREAHNAQQYYDGEHQGGYHQSSSWGI